MKNFVKALWVVIAGLFIASCSDLSENSTKISFMVPDLSRAAEGDAGTCTVKVSAENGFYYSATKTSDELFEIEVEPDVEYTVAVSLIFADGSQYSGSSSVFAKAGKENVVSITLKKVEKADPGDVDPDETAVLESISASYDSNAELGDEVINTEKLEIKENYSDGTSATGDISNYTIGLLPENSIGYVPVTVTNKSNTSISAVCYVPVYYDFAGNLTITSENESSIHLLKGASSENTLSADVSFALGSLNLYENEGSDSVSFDPASYITYKWYKDGSIISGAESLSYSFDTSTVGSYEYKLIVSTSDSNWITGNSSVSTDQITVYIEEIGTSDVTITSDSEITSAVSYAAQGEFNLSGSGDETVSVSNVSTSAITVLSGSTLNVSSLTFDGSENESNNTPVFTVSSGTLTLDGVIIKNNSNISYSEGTAGSTILVSSGILNIQNLTMTDNTNTVVYETSQVSSGDIQLTSGTINLNGYYSGSIYYDNSASGSSGSKTINVGSDFDPSSVIKIVLNQSVTSGTQILTSTSSLSDAQLACFTVQDLSGETYSLDSSGKVVIVTGSVTITYPEYSAGTLTVIASESTDSITFTASGTTITPVTYEWIINSGVCEDVTTASVTFEKSQFETGINTVTVIATDGTNYENASVYVTITK